MKAQYLLTLLLLNLANMTFAATCESTLASGQWSQTSTWINCNGMVPQDGDSVIVNNGHTVILDQNTALIESLTVVGGGDINVAATGFSINTDADGADINLQNATIELSGDLTINANGHKILLGSVDGAFDLTLNSSNETRFLGKIGGITELTSLITDSPGTTVFADTSAGTSTPNLKVNGLIEFNDPMLIAQRVIFSGNNTSVYFNNTIDSETTAKDLYILASVNSTL
jgi:hypothetical protein